MNVNDAEGGNSGAATEGLGIAGLLQLVTMIQFDWYVSNGLKMVETTN